MVEVPWPDLWETLKGHPEQQFLGVGVCVANVLECPEDPEHRRWHAWAVAIDHEHLVRHWYPNISYHSDESTAKQAAYVTAVQMDNSILRQLPEKLRHMKYPCEIKVCPCRELVPVEDDDGEA